MCDQQRASRRGFLAAGALGLGGLLALSCGNLQASSGKPTTLTADEALAQLKQGNKRFMDEPQLCHTQLMQQRQHVAAGQAPWATIVSCADSRVPPELLFGGVGLGQLFVVRNAGNMVDTAAMGSIEYGAAVLGVPLIVVLGHERCGAVAAACDVVRKGTQFPGSIGPMVEAIVPAALAVASEPGDMVENAVRESAMRTAKKIVKSSSILADLVRSGKVRVLAGKYDLDEGHVEFFGG
ncbi:MAG: carbonic anhydrase [Rhodoferax sp.]|nr:carbonic anhydrase [Rhodoferax sp.]